MVFKVVPHFYYWYSIKFLEPNRYAKFKLDSSVYGSLNSASCPWTSRLQYVHPGENLKPQYKPAYCTATAQHTFQWTRQPQRQPLKPDKGTASHLL